MSRRAIIAPVDVRPAQDPGEIEAAYELAARVFGPNYFESADLKRRVRLLEPLRSMHDVIVAVDDDEVVGLVRILDREMEGAEGPLPVGGVTSVCVHPRVRGTGIGVAIMESALERSRDRGDVCSVLFARRALDGWYPRLGYVGVGAHPHLRLQTPSAVRPEVGPMRQTRVGVYAGAYRASYGPLNLSFRRGRDWWALLAQQLELKPDLRFEEVTRKTDALGYLVRRGDTVIEAAAVPGGEHAVGGAAFACGALSLPVHHWLLRAARAMDHELTIRYSWDGGHMMRILDPERFVTALQVSRDQVPTGDVRAHDRAREFLLTVAGASGREPLWRDPPAWSLVDEF